MAKIILQAAAIAVVGFVLAATSLTLWRSFHPANPPNEAHGAQGSEAKDNHGKEDKGLLDRTAEDPVAFFTLWLTLFTGILAAFTIWMALSTKDLRDFAEEQARDMKESIAAAKASAEAAQKAVEVSDATAQRQLRAYLLPDRAVVPRSDVSLSEVEIKIKNFGQTPAYNVTSWWSAKVVDADEVDNDELFLFGETTKASVDVGPGGVLPLHGSTALGLIGQLREGKVFVAWGSVKYRDTFDRCQFMTFRLRSRWPMSAEGVEMIGAGRGNAASDPASEKDTGGPYKKALYPREGEIWRKD